MNLADIQIRTISYKDGNKIFEFIVNYFYLDEPLSSSEPKIIPGKLDREHILKCIKTGKSIMAVHSQAGEEKLVGVAIGTLKTPASIQEYYDDAAMEGNTKYGNILRILGDCSNKSDIFNRYDVNEIFYCFMSCVHTEYRGHNLGIRLKEGQMNLARDLGFKVISSDCTSFYSARVLERMGWDFVSSIMYKDYVDERGEQIFAISPPHEGIKTYAARL